MIAETDLQRIVRKEEELETIELTSAYSVLRIVSGLCRVSR